MAASVISNMLFRAARCRRFANAMVDEQARQALLNLAAEMDADVARLELDSRPAGEAERGEVGGRLRSRSPFYNFRPSRTLAVRQRLSNHVQRLVELNMPVLVQVCGERVPEEGENMAVIVLGPVFPMILKTVCPVAKKCQRVDPTVASPISRRADIALIPLSSSSSRIAALGAVSPCSMEPLTNCLPADAWRKARSSTAPFRNAGYNRTNLGCHKSIVRQFSPEAMRIAPTP
jgi:hypothetical protein